MKLRIFCTLLVSLLTLPLSAQEHDSLHDLVFPGLDSLADVLDGDPSFDFKKLPELRAQNGVLDVDLYVDRRWVQIGEVRAFLRSYSYRSGKQVSEEAGPWGPTLRLGPNDRLNLRIHNNLPMETDLEYLGSIPLDSEPLLVDGAVSRDLVRILEKAKIYSFCANRDSLGRINKEYVELDRVEVLVAGEKWRLHGMSHRAKSGDKTSSSETKHFQYLIERRFDPGVKKERLRVSKELSHSGHSHNQPHGFNTTNMHTHGWHVSPWQDDVFRQVPPQQFSLYSYELEDHTSGTFWYHPHVHGSTALQVASGMSGALIVDDRDLRSWPLLAAASRPEHERILLINQVNYDPETLELQSFEQASWQKAPQGTTINGIPQPKMAIRPGEVQRWRLIQSGHDAAVAMHFPDLFEVWQIAIDGIYLRAPRRLRTLHLAPGNRSDVLIKSPRSVTDGLHPIQVVKMIPKCEYFPEDEACTKQPDKCAEVLIHLNVGGEPLDMGLPKELPELAPILADVTDDELINREQPRKVKFNIRLSPKPVEFHINGRPFKPGVIDQTLTLGTAEEWDISSIFSWHPFHIHVNPFQVTQFDGQAVNPPIWKDVLMVSSPKKCSEPKRRKTLVRSRYTRHWGDFVLHCHILHHEDLGMMQRIRIERPDVSQDM